MFVPTTTTTTTTTTALYYYTLYLVLIGTFCGKAQTHAVVELFVETRGIKEAVLFGCVWLEWCLQIRIEKEKEKEKKKFYCRVESSLAGFRTPSWFVKLTKAALQRCYNNSFGKRERQQLKLHRGRQQL